MGDDEFEVSNSTSTCTWDNNSNVKNNTTTVYFDPSFADARPQSCAYWFNGFEKVRTIEDAKYLNTSQVTSMRSMFDYCKTRWRN